MEYSQIKRKKNFMILDKWNMKVIQVWVEWVVEWEEVCMVEWAV
jgi:hypothetical protein